MHKYIAICLFNNNNNYIYIYACVYICMFVCSQKASCVMVACAHARGHSRLLPSARPYVPPPGIEPGSSA